MTGSVSISLVKVSDLATFETMMENFDNVQGERCHNMFVHTKDKEAYAKREARKRGHISATRTRR